MKLLQIPIEILGRVFEYWTFYWECIEAKYTKQEQQTKLTITGEPSFEKQFSKN